MHSRLTWIKRDIVKLEDKEGLTYSDQRKIKRLKEKAKEHDRDFEQRHVLNFIKTEDKAALDLEEAVFDEHVNYVSDIIERLEQLEDLFDLSRRLSHVYDSLMKVKRVVEDKELDMCLLEGYEEKLKSINTYMQGLKRDMLLIDEYESLAGKAAGLEEASFELQVAIKHLLKNTKTESTVSKDKGLSGVKLPKVSVLTFDGKVLNWKSFCEQFDTTIHYKTGLNDTEKLLYWQDALKNGPARFVIQGLTQTSENYEEAITCLKDRYDRLCLV